MYLGKDLHRHYNDDDSCNMVADMYFGMGMHYNGCNNMGADIDWNNIEVGIEEYYSEIREDEDTTLHCHGHAQAVDVG